MIFIIFELVFFAVLLAGDLVSKHYVMPFLASRVDDNYTYVAIKDVLTFEYSLNSGASLGIFSGKTGLLIGITVVSMVLLFLAIVFFHFKKLHKNPKGRFLLCSLIMILSGGIANLYDRIACDGFVRDFIQYTFLEKIFGSSLFTCNVADIWVSLGVVFLLIYILFLYKEKKPEVCLEPADDDEANVKDALKMYDEHNETNDKESK